MDFSIDEQQQAIADAAARVFAAYCDDHAVAEFADSGAAYSQPLWRQLAETGMLALALPEDHGGSGLGMQELALVLEQQGRHLAPVPLWRHQLAALAIARFGDAALQREALPAAVAGDTLLTLGLDDLQGPHGVRVQATGAGDALVLHGEISVLAQAEAAQLALVAAEYDHSVRLCAVALDDARVRMRPGVATHGEAVASVQFDGVAVPAARLLPVEATEWLHPRALACVAALQLGVAEEALARTARYVSERQQFGQPIGSFQAVAMRAADGYIDCEVLRSTLWQLLWRLDAGLPAAAAAAVVKVWACHGGHRVAHAAQHLHGGMGADVSYPIHRYFLWSCALEMTLGGANAQLEVLGDWLAGSGDAGFDV